MKSSIAHRSNDLIELTVSGSIAEAAADELKLIEPSLTLAQIRIDSSKVTHLNSLGIVAWINFIRRLTRDKAVEFVACSVAMVQTAIVFPQIFGTAKVSSLLIPYLCDACDEHQVILMKVEDLATADGQLCRRCHGPAILGILGVENLFIGPPQP